MFQNIYKNARAIIKGGKEFPKINGTVNFKETKDGIIMTAKITNLPHSKNNCNRKILWFSYT